VDIFVLARRVPAERRWPNVHYVTDITTAVEQAKATAGDREVLLHGAHTAQECLRAGLLDEMEIALVPVLLGQGRRLFDGLGCEHVELELVRNLQGDTVTHLRYRVRKA
jgi:dihydrofolate reductase